MINFLSPIYLHFLMILVCDVIDGIHECVIVKTVVTVFLEPDEDPTEVRRKILDGFNAAFNDGTFFEALPN